MQSRVTGSSGSSRRPVHSGTKPTKLIAINVKRRRHYHQVWHQSFQIVSNNVVADVPLAILADHPIVSVQASVLTCSQVYHRHQRFASVQKSTPGL
jgi:hypothetical protein